MWYLPFDLISPEVKYGILLTNTIAKSLDFNERGVDAIPLSINSASS